MKKRGRMDRMSKRIIELKKTEDINEVNSLLKEKWCLYLVTPLKDEISYILAKREKDI